MKQEEFESRIGRIIEREQARLAEAATKSLAKLTKEVQDVPAKVGTELDKYGESLKRAFDIRDLLGAERVLELMENEGVVHSWIREKRSGASVMIRDILRQMSEDDEFCWSRRGHLDDTRMKVTLIIEPIAEVQKRSGFLSR